MMNVEREEPHQHQQRAQEGVEKNLTDA
jgi:hypothetical protein